MLKWRLLIQCHVVTVMAGCAEMSEDGASAENFDPNKLCEEFVQIASSNSAEAAMFLQENNWSLEQALNAFFSSSAAGGPPDNLPDDNERAPPKKKMKIGSPSIPVTVTGTSHSSANTPSPKPDTSNSAHAVTGSTGRTTPDEKLSHSSAEETGSVSCKSSNELVGADKSSSGCSDKDLNRIRVLSWNIDGLDENNKITRTRAACKEMLKINPDVIFLQEVVPETLRILTEFLPSSSYNTFPAAEENYFTVMITNKKTVWVDESNIHPFFSSLMGRKLQHSKVNIKGIDFALFTTHLESTAAHQKERLNQLNQIFRKMTDTDPSYNVLLGGDLNLGKRDSIKLPERTIDVWENTGKRKEAEWTWDTTKNDNVSASFKAKCRFDRFFFRADRSNQVKPIYFELVGLEKVPSCSRFPSDHWGILAHFEINPKLTTS